MLTKHGSFLFCRISASWLGPTEGVAISKRSLEVCSSVMTYLCWQTRSWRTAREAACRSPCRARPLWKGTEGAQCPCGGSSMAGCSGCPPSHHSPVSTATALLAAAENSPKKTPCWAPAGSCLCLKRLPVCVPGAGAGERVGCCCLRSERSPICAAPAAAAASSARCLCWCELQGSSSCCQWALAV